LEELSPLEREGYKELEGLEVILDIRKILELEYRIVDLKLFIGIHINFMGFFFVFIYFPRIYHVDLYLHVCGRSTNGFVPERLA